MSVDDQETLLPAASEKARKIAALKQAGSVSRHLWTCI